MATDQNDELLRTLSAQLGDIAGLLGEIRDRFPAPSVVGPDEADVVELSEPARDDRTVEVELAEPEDPAPTPDAAPLSEPATPARKAAKKAAPRRAPKTKEAP